MKIIGLCGGSGAGKGEVCRLFEKYGIPSVDTDAVSRTVMKKGEDCYNEVVQAFGNEILDENGEIIPAGYVNQRLMSGAGFGVGLISDVTCLYDAIKNERFLKPETWEKVFTPSTIGDFGVGCIVFDWNGKLTYQHNGGFLGFRTIHRYLPNEDFDIIVLSNVGFVDARTVICDKIHEIYFGDRGKTQNPEMDKGFIPDR